MIVYCWAKTRKMFYIIATIELRMRTESHFASTLCCAQYFNWSYNLVTAVIRQLRSVPRLHWLSRKSQSISADGNKWKDDTTNASWPKVEICFSTAIRSRQRMGDGYREKKNKRKNQKTKKAKNQKLTLVDLNVDDADWWVLSCIHILLFILLRLWLKRTWSLCQYLICPSNNLYTFIFNIENQKLWSTNIIFLRFVFSVRLSCLLLLFRYFFSVDASPFSLCRLFSQVFFVFVLLVAAWWLLLAHRNRDIDIKIGSEI